MDTTLIDLLDTYKNDKECENYFLEQRFPNGVYCVFCKHDKVYKIETKNKCQKFKCAKCKERFSAITGTIFESTKLGLRKWFLAFYLIQTASKGISSIQLSKQLKVTQKTAWFILHRFREIAQENFRVIGGTVEMDETFIGGKERNKHEHKRLKQGRGTIGKTAVMGAISRDNKQAVAYPVSTVSHDSVGRFVRDNLKKGSVVFADECTAYDKHTMLRVNHSKKQYVDSGIHTNNIESFWATIKRGYIGIYHWWSKKHLKRYIDEFTFRFNHKEISFGDLLTQSINKRLKYKGINSWLEKNKDSR